MLTLEMSKSGSAETPMTIRWGDALVDVTRVTGDDFRFPAGPATVHVRYRHLSQYDGHISWDLDGSEIACRPRAFSAYGSFAATARVPGGNSLLLDASARGCSGILIRDQAGPLATVRHRPRGVSEVTIRTGHPVPAALLAGFGVFLLFDPHPYVSSG